MATYKEIAEDIVANNPELSHGGDYKGFVQDIQKNNPELKFDITENTFVPDFKNMIGGKNETLSQAPGLLQNITSSIARPINIGKEAFLNQASVGLIPKTKGLAPVEDISGGYMGDIVAKGAELAGNIAGNLVGGEISAKSIGLVGKAVKSIPTIQSLKYMRDYTPITIQTAREVQNIPKVLQTNFGQLMKTAQEANPTVRVSLESPLSNLMAVAENDPVVKGAITKVSKGRILKNFVDNPSVAGDLSLKDAQQIANDILKELPEGYSKSRTKHMFDMAISENFPEMKEARAVYGAGMSDYELLHSLENTGSNINKIRQSLVNQNIQDAAKRRLSATLNSEIAKYSDMYQSLNKKAFKVFGVETQSLAKLIEKNKLKDSLLSRIKTSTPNQISSMYKNMIVPTINTYENSMQVPELTVEE